MLECNVVGLHRGLVPHGGLLDRVRVEGVVRVPRPSRRGLASAFTLHPFC